MNRKGPLIAGTVRALTPGTGLTAMPGLGVRAAHAVSLQDQQLEENLAAEHLRVRWSAQPDGNGASTSPPS